MSDDQPPPEGGTVEERLLKRSLYCPYLNNWRGMVKAGVPKDKALGLAALAMSESIEKQTETITQMSMYQVGPTIYERKT